MKNAHKIMIILIILTAVIVSACCDGCGCGGCCGDDESDKSKDVDKDGDKPSEQQTNSLSTVQQSQTQAQKPASICDGVNSNVVSVQGKKEKTSGNVYSYTYSYSIKACASMVTYNLEFRGQSSSDTKPIETARTAPKGVETTNIASNNPRTEAKDYSQVCVKGTGIDSGEKCSPFN